MLKNKIGLKARHSNILRIILVMIAVMVALTAASVPLYSIFCKVTGYGGTVDQSSISASHVGKRNIKISFDSNIDTDLPWSFKAEQRLIEVTTGHNAIVFYHVANNSDQPIVGMASYNVVPHKAGKYFKKIACFCFERQLLLPHQQILMPVTFFIDPAIEDDPEMWDVSSMTLSYTFYKLE